MAAVFKLLEGGTSEVEVKKSRFYGFTFPVETAEEAEMHVEELRKKHFKARHHCYAYRLEGAEKFSDDGEPSQTAGKPMMDILTGENLVGALVVVVRYFGGTLLGTGGLVRAYSDAAKEAVRASRIMEICPRRHVECRISYTDLGKIQYIFQETGLTFSAEYGEDILLSAEVPDEQVIMITAKVVETTAGKGQISVGDLYLG